jgi:hypothetical protein
VGASVQHCSYSVCPSLLVGHPKLSLGQVLKRSAASAPSSTSGFSRVIEHKGGRAGYKKCGVGRTPLNDSRLLWNHFLLRCLALLLLVLGSEFLSNCLR